MGEAGVAVALEAMEGECGCGGGGEGDVACTSADTGEGGFFGVGVVQKGVICSDCDGAVENEDAVGEG
jgi:hypothetical protein